MTNTGTPLEIVRDILEGARSLIQKGWCKGEPAKDKHGTPIHVRSPYATQFCLSGACHAASQEFSPSAAYRAIVELDRELLTRRLEHDTYLHSIEAFNDHDQTSSRDVVQLIDDTLESIDGDESMNKQLCFRVYRTAQRGKPVDYDRTGEELEMDDNSFIGSFFANPGEDILEFIIDAADLRGIELYPDEIDEVYAIHPSGAGGVIVDIDAYTRLRYTTERVQRITDHPQYRKVDF